MDDLSSLLPPIVAALALVTLNGIFVAAEFALVRTMATKLRAPELSGKYGVTSALKLLEKLDQSISTTQLGITVISLVLGWFGERTFHRLFAGLFTHLGEPYSSLFSHTVSTALALLVVTVLHVVLGELVAKSIAIRYPETTLRIVAGPLRLINEGCRPFVILLNGSANIFLRIFGIHGAMTSERVHTSGELAMLISQSSEQGILDKDEEEMLQGVFGFSETIAREVMTPRTDLVTIPSDATFREVISTISQSGFSRFPVIETSIDNIIGFLLSRDLLPVVERYTGTNAKPFSVSDIMRESYFVPGTKSINDLLKEFKQRKLHMAIVLDEHGGVDGAVTLEDIIEEIVGDIYDESDAIESDIHVEEGGDVIVDGGVLVDDINEKFELSIPEGEYDTIAGFIMSSLGRVPQPGDQISISRVGMPMVYDKASESGGNGAENSSIDGASQDEESDVVADFDAPNAILTVEKVTGNRIESIRLTQLKSGEPEVPSEAGQ